MRFVLSVKPRVFYFLQSFCNGESLKLPAKDERSEFIFFLIRVGKKLKQFNYVENFDTSTYRLTYPVEIPTWCVFQYGISEITNEATVQINARLEDEFRQAFYYEMSHLHFVQKYDIKDALILLMQKWGIDEEILSTDTLIKDYYRFRKKNERIFKKSTMVNVLTVGTNTRYHDGDVLKIRIEKVTKEKLMKVCKKKNMKITTAIHSLVENYISHADHH